MIAVSPPARVPCWPSPSVGERGDTHFGDPGYTKKPACVAHSNSDANERGGRWGGCNLSLHMENRRGKKKEEQM